MTTDADAPAVWLTRPQLALRLKLPVSTLAHWVKDGSGPPFGKFGRHVRYRLKDVMAWEDERVDRRSA